MPPRQCSRSRSWRVQHSCVPSKMATLSPSPAAPFSMSAVLYSMRPAAACNIGKQERQKTSSHKEHLTDSTYQAMDNDTFLLWCATTSLRHELFMSTI